MKYKKRYEKVLQVYLRAFDTNFSCPSDVQTMLYFFPYSPYYICPLF